MSSSEIELYIWTCRSSLTGIDDVFNSSIEEAHSFSDVSSSRDTRAESDIGAFGYAARCSPACVLAHERIALR